MSQSIELAVGAKATLGEGPCWDSEKKLLYWVDIMEKKVHIHDPRTGRNRAMNVGQHVGAAVLRKSGGMILATQQGFHALDLESGQLTPMVDPESHLEHNRFNDGKCDAAGRFWAGTMGFTVSGPVGSLYSLETDGTVRAHLHDISCSNGIAWSPDNRTMYYIDTPTKQVAAFDYNLQTGDMSNKRTAVTIPDGEGAPDGMTIDSEGMLWVAHWGGHQVSRWNPHTGERIDSIPIPAAQVTSCVFGGEDLDVLYITTARVGLDDEALEKLPQSGGVFKYKTKVKGSPTYKYNG